MLIVKKSIVFALKYEKASLRVTGKCPPGKEDLLAPFIEKGTVLPGKSEGDKTSNL